MSGYFSDHLIPCYIRIDKEKKQALAPEMGTYLYSSDYVEDNDIILAPVHTFRKIHSNQNSADLGSERSHITCFQLMKIKENVELSVLTSGESLDLSPVLSAAAELAELSSHTASFSLHTQRFDAFLFRVNQSLTAKCSTDP